MLWQLRCTWERLTVPCLCCKGGERQPLRTALPPEQPLRSPPLVPAPPRDAPFAPGEGFLDLRCHACPPCCWLPSVSKAQSRVELPCPSQAASPRGEKTRHLFSAALPCLSSASQSPASALQPPGLTISPWSGLSFPPRSKLPGGEVDNLTA